MHAKRNPAGRRGEAKRFKEAPPGVRLGDNANAFLGGFPSGNVSYAERMYGLGGTAGSGRRRSRCTSE